MILYPAIDLYNGKAVRLFRGDYGQMTVYSPHPEELAEAFRAAGATHMHLVDLEGAKAGSPQNLPLMQRLIKAFGGFTQIGGGIRSMASLEACLELGADRVILGTAAVTDRAFLREALQSFGEKIALGMDLREGFVAIRGWQEKTPISGEAFLRQMEDLGVKTLICTDISKDGAMSGTNRALYARLAQSFSGDLIASGGVSTLSDIAALKELGLSGAIVGKAYYSGAINLKEALEVGR